MSFNFSDIETRYQKLKEHNVFGSIKTMDDLRLFMRWHVFAVWDFMSLAKRLQQQLTCTSVPWLPPRYPVAARLINEIILGEESDEMPEGGYLSHYEMYLAAMEEIGADTQQIREFIELLNTGIPVAVALSKVDAPLGIQEFVNHTLEVAETGDLYQVLGNFFFGRENMIPMMFRSLLNKWHIDESKAPMFVYYLNRHIELDSDSHGPAVLKIINQVTGDDPVAVTQLRSAAVQAIQARISLWDSLTEAQAQQLV